MSSGSAESAAEADAAIRVTVAGIDERELGATVLRASANYAGGAEIAAGSGAYRATVLGAALDDIDARLDRALRRATPRTTLPPRFARMRAVARPLLQLYNYVRKEERETARDQIESIRALVAVVRMLGAAYDD